MDVAIEPVTLLLPALFAVVCIVGFLQARREGRRRRATLFASGLIIGVLPGGLGLARLRPASRVLRPT